MSRREFRRVSFLTAGTFLSSKRLQDNNAEHLNLLWMELFILMCLSGGGNKEINTAHKIYTLQEGSSMWSIERVGIWWWGGLGIIIDKHLSPASSALWSRSYRSSYVSLWLLS